MVHSCCICRPTVVFRLHSTQRIVSSLLKYDFLFFYIFQLIFFLSLLFVDGYELGGLATSVKRDGMDSGMVNRGKGNAYKEPHCLYPGDLYPFTRRPMFIIIDSDNSFVFQHIPRYFGQPLVILMSPQDVPTAFQGEFSGK